MTNQRHEPRTLTLEGAIDLHCHFGPERFVEELFGAERHAVNAIEAAAEAAAHGMRGIVLKGHEFATTGVAYLAQQAVPEVEVFSGICLDHPVGCLNPHATEVALRNGAKYVWMPTLSARGSVPALREQGFGDSEGVRVLDEDGAVASALSWGSDRTPAEARRAHRALLAPGAYRIQAHLRRADGTTKDVERELQIDREDHAIRVHLE